MKIIRGALLVLFILLLSSFAEAQLTLNLSRDKFGTGQQLEGTLEIDLSQPVPKDTALIFIINDISHSTKTISNITSKVQVYKHPADVAQIGTPIPSKELIFAGPGSLVDLALDLSQGGAFTQTDVQDITDFALTAQGSQGITSPSLNIGNDKDIEWTYIGPPRPNVFLPLNDSYLGNRDVEAEVSLTAESDNLFCQNVTLQPATKFRIKTLAKALNPQAALNATLSKDKLDSTFEICGDDAPCCTFPTKPPTLQEMTCDINFQVSDTQNYYMCVYVASTPGQADEEAYSLALKTTQPALGLKGGRKTPVNYFIWGHYQDYEKQLSSSVSLTSISEQASAEIKSYAKKQGCGNKCLLVPLNFTSTSAGRLALSNLEVKAQTSFGTLTYASFVPVKVTPESISYNLSILKEFLTSHSSLKAPTVEGDDITIKAVLGELASNEEKFDVVEGPKVSIRYNKNSLGPGEILAVEASATRVGNRDIVKYEWDFGDGQKALGRNATHRFTKSGTYTVQVTVTDEDEITGTDILSVRVAALSLSEQLNKSQHDLETLQDKLSTDSALKALADKLKLTEKIEAAQANLTALKTSSSNATNRTEDLLQQELDMLQSSVPKDLAIDGEINFDAKILSPNEVPPSIVADANAVYAAQEDVTITGKATLVRITTLNEERDNFILIEKKITGTGTYYESLPTNVLLKEEITPFDKAVSSNLFEFGTSTILYTVEGGSLPELTAATQTKTLVVPEELPQGTVEGTIELTECGNKRCEAGEDADNCPEDCSVERPILPFIILGVVLILGLLWIFIYKGKYSFAYFFGSKISSSARIFFRAEKDYLAVKNYMQDALRKGFKEEQIKLALKKKGWQDHQINAVSQELKKPVSTK